jgi:hypothetical protein
MRIATGTSWPDPSDGSLQTAYLPNVMRQCQLWLPYFMRVWIVGNVFHAKRLVFLIGAQLISPLILDGMITMNARSLCVAPTIPDFIFEKIASELGEMTDLF